MSGTSLNPDRYQPWEEKGLPPLPNYRRVLSERDGYLKDDRIGVDRSPQSGRAFAPSITVARQSSWQFWKAIWVSRKRANPIIADTLPEEVKYWKPATLRAPVLLSFTFSSLALILLLEYLGFISSSDNNANGGGVAFAATVNDLSGLDIFGYLYLPTTLAVIYSTLWSWVDLDTKRLEPWFQLSKSDGAGAEDSLLLQYPFDFLAFVPIRAARRRHWLVFLAGSIMMLIFWVITPLQAAIFTTGTVIRTRQSDMTDVGSLTAISLQQSMLSTDFMNTAYGISWLGQKLPAYTTKDIAIVPFAPARQSSGSLPTESWSTSANAYSTNLTCTPAYTTVDNLSGSYTFDNGRGCSVSGISLPQAKAAKASYMVLYVQYYDNAESDYSLQNPNCSLDHSHNYLALWGSAASQSNIGTYGNLTAIFCEPSYSIRTVSALVNASDGSVASVETIVPAPTGTALSDVNKVFNITNFEYIIGTGVSFDNARKDYPDSNVLEQFPRLQTYSLAWPVSNMVGFAVSANPSTVENLVDPAILGQAFSKAHSLLFSVAISTLMSSTVGNNQISRSGLIVDNPGAIIYVRAFAIAVEASLAAAATLTFILWFLARRRPSKMLKDPSSISSIMSLMKDTEISSALLEDTLTRSDKVARSCSSQLKFCLSTTLSDRASFESRLVVIEKGNKQFSDDLPSKRHSGLSEKLGATQPIELGIYTGLALVLFISSGIAALCFLFFLSVQENGLSRPSSNSFIMSVLENVVPTAFATILEPFWVVLNRLLCLLKPYVELRKGNAQRSTSVDVRYTSLPPQLVVWRALRARHFLLAALCVIAVSTNILAVTLSSLLNEEPATSALTLQTSSHLSPAFNGSSIVDFGGFGTGVPITYSDHFYVAFSNLTHGTPLPPWTDERFFYLPFDIMAIPIGIAERFDAAHVQEWQGLTTGFGASVNCEPLVANDSNNTVLFDPGSGGSSVQFSTSHRLPNGTQITCVAHDDTSIFNQTTTLTGSYSLDAMALEIMTPMTPANRLADDSFCSNLIVAGWARLGPSVPLTLPNNGTDGRSLQTSFMSCKPTLSVAQFTVNVDFTGRILSSFQTSDFSSDLSPYFQSLNFSHLDLFRQSNSLIAPALVGDFVWHNDSFTSDWMNALLRVALNGTSTISSPSSLPPPISVVGPAFSAVYAELFAMLLGLNTHIFASSQPSSQNVPTVTLLITSTRIFVSTPMFQASIILMALHLIMAIAYYAFRPPKFLPQMPTSIATVMGFVAGSRAVAELKEGRTTGGDVRYGYGRFVDVSGKTRVGIELAERVVPLGVRNPGARRKWWRLWKPEEKNWL